MLNEDHDKVLLHTNVGPVSWTCVMALENTSGVLVSCTAGGMCMLVEGPSGHSCTL